VRDGDLWRHWRSHETQVAAGADGSDTLCGVVAGIKWQRERADAAEEREGRLREALALLWAEATDPGRGPVHLSQPCRSAVLRARAALDGGEG
jgi:hypothetical protein